MSRCKVLCVMAITVLSGCQTPASVQNMSTLLAKYSTQMDGAMTTYVAGLNTSNDLDTTRLQGELAVAARLQVTNTDEVAIWQLTSGARAANVTRTLQMISSTAANDPDPLTGSGLLAPSALLQSPPTITFDDAPLKTIGSVAGSLSKPITTSEELSVLATYARQVQTDMKNTTPGTTAAAGAGH